MAAASEIHPCDISNVCMVLDAQGFYIPSFRGHSEHDYFVLKELAYCSLSFESGTKRFASPEYMYDAADEYAVWMAEQEHGLGFVDFSYEDEEDKIPFKDLASVIHQIWLNFKTDEKKAIAFGNSLTEKVLNEDFKGLYGGQLSMPICNLNFYDLPNLRAFERSRLVRDFLPQEILFPCKYHVNNNNQYRKCSKRDSVLMAYFVNLKTNKPNQEELSKMMQNIKIN